jgi:hypothetical protein
VDLADVARHARDSALELSMMPSQEVQLRDQAGRHRRLLDDPLDDPRLTPGSSGGSELSELALESPRLDREALDRASLLGGVGWEVAQLGEHRADVRAGRCRRRRASSGLGVGRLDGADLDEGHPWSGERRPEGEELPRRKAAQPRDVLAAREAELPSGARHVDVEPAPADQLVVALGRGRLPELGDPLRREDGAEPALARERHERLDGGSALGPPALGAELLGLVKDEDHRVPELAGCVDQRGEEAGHEGVPRRAELVDVNDRRHVELQQAARQERCARHVDPPVAAAGRGEHIVESLPEGVKLSLDVDHDVLADVERLLEEAPDRPALATAGVGLDEHPGRDQAIDVDLDAGAEDCARPGSRPGSLGFCHESSGQIRATRGRYSRGDLRASLRRLDHGVDAAPRSELDGALRLAAGRLELPEPDVVGGHVDVVGGEAVLGRPLSRVGRRPRRSVEEDRLDPAAAAPTLAPRRWAPAGSVGREATLAIFVRVLGRHAAVLRAGALLAHAGDGGTLLLERRRARRQDHLDLSL